ncbi:MAG TPA: hypothetical protein VFF98_17345 [Novosphingobium sp.]|nr:hypothetical protein [Novosphingobium sp.]HZV11305.1 hypothetical protein [Novosphingobium sp.]
MAGALPILQHALGLDEHGRGEAYRSHFVVGPGCEDYDICLAATAAGLMRHRTCDWIVDGHIFHVTDDGRAYVAEHSPPPPKRTASQLRYQRYLDADCSLTFGEWLRRQSKQARAAKVRP